MPKSRKTRRAEAHRAIAAAVRSHKDKDGMVKVYPTLPLGAATVPGRPYEVDQDGKPVAQLVSADEALKLLEFRPPAFTLYESGNPLEAHKELDAIDFEQAWGDPEPEDEVTEPMPQGDVVEPEPPQGENTEE